MEEVLWHWATTRFSKSIFVNMPRLPTIRVIGSQFISTRLPFLPGVLISGAVIVLMAILLFSSIRSRFITRRQLGSRVSPLRFLIDGFIGKGSQGPDRTSVDTDRAG